MLLGVGIVTYVSIWVDLAWARAVLVCGSRVVLCFVLRWLCVGFWAVTYPFGSAQPAEYIGHINNVSSRHKF